MTYVILSKELELNTLYKIAANDTDLNNLNINQDDYRVISISDSDWNLLQKDLVKIQSSTENSITFETIIKHPTNGFFSEQDLRRNMAGWIEQINAFVRNPSNVNHPDRTVWASYKSYMVNFDYSQITFPMHQTFWEFCADQPGLQWRNILQMP